MAPPVRLTTVHCTNLADLVRQSLKSLQIALPETSDLTNWLKDCDWAGSIGGNLIDPTGGPYTVDRNRTIGLLLRLLQLRDVARALERCAAIPGADPKRIRAAVKRRFDRTVTVDAQAQDTLFELEMAAIFFKGASNVAFREPDLGVYILGVGELGIACKRVAKVDRLRARISEAAKQVQRQGGVGAVLVDMQPVLYATGDPDKKTYADFVETRNELSAAHSDSLRQHLAEAGSEIAASRAKGVVAVAATAMVWGVVQPKAGAADFEITFAWLVEVPESPTREEVVLRQLLRENRALDW